MGEEDRTELTRILLDAIQDSVKHSDRIPDIVWALAGEHDPRWAGMADSEILECVAWLGNLVDEAEGDA